MSIPDTMIELNEISLTGFSGRNLFSSLQFELKPEETAIITGPTGSGKTSLVELIIGAAEPDRGTVRLFGKKLSYRRIGQVARLRRKIGGVGGIYSLISNQTVYENLINPMIFRKETARHKRNKIKKYLEEFGLVSRENTPAGSLSQGERIQVMLVRAIIADQPLLLVDEPLAGLDGEVGKKVINLLRRLATGGHTLVIFTSSEEELGIPNPTCYRLEKGTLR